MTSSHLPCAHAISIQQVMIYMYNQTQRQNAIKTDIEHRHHHNGVPTGLGIGLPVTCACSFRRARRSPSILLRSSCSACWFCQYVLQCLWA